MGESRTVATGVSLGALFNTRRELPTLQALDIAIAAARFLQSHHEAKGGENDGIHGNISPDSLIYDPLSHQISASANSSLKKKAVKEVVQGKEVTIEKWQGDMLDGYYHYMAPGMEQPNADTRESNVEISFSKAADIYALGKILEEMFGFTPIMQQDIPFRMKSPIRYDETLRALLKEMTTLLGEGGDLNAVISHLEELRTTLEPVVRQATGIFKIDDIENAKKGDPKKWAAMLAALRSVDVVVLIDCSAKNRNVASYGAIKEILRAEGVFVTGEVQKSKNVVSAVAEIKGDHLCYFQPASSSSAPRLPDSVQHISVTPAKKDYRRIVRESGVIVPQEQIEKIATELEREAARLQKKHGDLDGRITPLRRKAEELRSNQSPRTFAKLYTDLEKLEKALIKLKQPRFSFYGLFKPKSARVVHHAAKELKTVSAERAAIIKRKVP